MGLRAFERRRAHILNNLILAKIQKRWARHAVYYIRDKAKTASIEAVLEFDL